MILRRIDLVRCDDIATSKVVGHDIVHSCQTVLVEGCTLSSWQGESHRKTY